MQMTVSHIKYLNGANRQYMYIFSNDIKICKIPFNFPLELVVIIVYTVCVCALCTHCTIWGFYNRICLNYYYSSLFATTKCYITIYKMKRQKTNILQCASTALRSKFL